MRKRRKQLPDFYLGILSLIGLIYLILNFPPSFQFVINSKIFPILPVFFLFIFAVFYFLMSFAFLNKRRGIEVSGFIVAFLLLRLNNLANLFFLSLLLILTIAFELFFFKKK